MAHPQMTPEEYLKMQQQIAAMRNQKAQQVQAQQTQQAAPPPGMVSQSAMTPEALAVAQEQAAQSTGGMQARLSSQQAFADQLCRHPVVLHHHATAAGLTLKFVFVFCPGCSDFATRL